jgi:hypothetical protein
MALIASGLVLMLVARLAEARHVQALSVHDDLVIKQAQWVLQQLRDASEAYSDLALGSVLEAAAFVSMARLKECAANCKSVVPSASLPAGRVVHQYYAPYTTAHTSCTGFWPTSF